MSPRSIPIGTFRVTCSSRKQLTLGLPKQDEVDLLGLRRVDTAKACALSILIAGLAEAPFALLTMGGPHSGFGWIGMFFFLPSFNLTSLLLPGSVSETATIAATLVCQTILLFVPIFWTFTWRKRPPRTTWVGILCWIVLLAAASFVAYRLEARQIERDEAMRRTADNAAVSSLEVLNQGLAQFKEKYGEYPARLEQLAFPPEGPANGERAGFITYPVPAQEFFTLTYTPQKQAGEKYDAYEIFAEAKPGQRSDLYHYYTDESGLILLGVSHEGSKHGSLVPQQAYRIH